MDTVIEGILGVVSIGVNIVFSPLLRGSRMRWGATEQELQQRIPGDEISSPHPRFVATRGISIRASRKRVWSWLVQLGCGRGGWYSYDLLDNGGRPSTNRIQPELQNLEVGATLPMTPDGKMAMPVRAIRPNEYVVLGGTLDPKTGKEVDILGPNVKEYFSWVITYALEPDAGGGTRLVSRNRADWNPSLMNNVAFGLFVEAISFVMETKMMQGVKVRAERG